MKFVISAIVAFLILISCTAFARVAPAPGCNGSPEMCAQIAQLQQDLAQQKALNAQTAADVQAAHAQKMAKIVACAATVAVALKALISMLKSWTSFLKTDRQKARMKVILLLLGFASFFAGSIGLGLPWWQSLILAGGPPGAILVHEIAALIPALRGQGPLPPDDSGTPPAVTIA